MKTIVAAAIGECVHVAGVSNFLRLAEQVGWRVIFLGPATPIKKILEVAEIEKADLVGVSYRLTPENGERLLGEFAEEADALKSKGVNFAFGGTPPIVERIEKLNFFEICFNGTESTEEVVSYLKGQRIKIQEEQSFPQKTVDRIKWKSPFPLIRHHFGLPTMQSTLDGIKQIADSKMVDVISLGIDQDAQENFFHPERQTKRRMGAGGVPVRTAEDYQKLYEASRSGNFPLMRTYSGTDDFLQLAEMYIETINIAWAAVPLFWFNKMDGRGPWDLEGSIREHQKLMGWYGERNIPVEANEAHHWGMRDASDVIFVVSAYLAAYNARAFGVKDHIVQLMFNSPPGTSSAMDIAKMLALMELVSDLETPNFKTWKQTRTGLLSYPVDLEQAKAHLATTVYVQMALKPDIVHVVGYPEADHAVTGLEVVESSKMARKAIEHALQSQIDLTSSENIQLRVQELITDAKLLIEAICQLSQSNSIDPLTDPAVLSAAVTEGFLDAPQLLNNPHGRGEISTMIDHRGACVAVEKTTGKSITEKDRVLQRL
ncbi:MAG: cobalamin B12-binding domain-containing protein [Chloroflexi bacterium]|nr:cobalamin B12-binding domain-containing protein [Chloroflexota bacterium]MBT3671067.1 cobalamin B12-binding domain-containing protein [Chloroflexota bacterium]MBT4002154.1 cobalamin B12-binding domain-containing protein [Chloroflexota bacterium]MBT4304882.1 cobalamin B12-binding domain-containing protein [Chloroflexota bacterium]MBT4534030.1 cobalamin B12-binding domain-containing protein [Chloroflexota bacterium]